MGPTRWAALANYLDWKKVEQLNEPFCWESIFVCAIVVVVGSALINTWAMSYDTYMKEHEQQK